jgi:predicted transcriptional regulator
MTEDIFDQINSLTSEELELLKTVSSRGAATADEVALELDRPGEDLSVSMDRLVEKGLVEVHNFSIEDEEFPIYQVDPRIKKSIG